MLLFTEKTVSNIPVIFGYFIFDHFSCFIGLISMGTAVITGVAVAAMSHHVICKTICEKKTVTTCFGMLLINH